VIVDFVGTEDGFEAFKNWLSSGLLHTDLHTELKLKDDQKLEITLIKHEKFVFSKEEVTGAEPTSDPVSPGVSLASPAQKAKEEVTRAEPTSDPVSPGVSQASPAQKAPPRLNAVASVSNNNNKDNEKKNEGKYLLQPYSPINIRTDWSPKEDYFVHIDVLCNSTSKVSKRINSFMVGTDAFDPRRAVNFPKDLMNPNVPDTLQYRREVTCMGQKYYELWKVRKNFSKAAFGEMVASLDKGVKVRLVRIIDNEHEITSWNGAA